MERESVPCLLLTPFTLSFCRMKILSSNRGLGFDSLSPFTFYLHRAAPSLSPSFPSPGRMIASSPRLFTDHMGNRRSVMGDGRSSHDDERTRLRGQTKEHAGKGGEAGKKEK